VLEPRLTVRVYRTLLRQLVTIKGLPADIVRKWMATLVKFSQPGDVAETLETAQTWAKAADSNQALATEARTVLDQALPLSSMIPSQQQAMYRTQMAALYEQIGDTQRAEELYRQVLKFDPHEIFAANNLAMICARRKTNLDEAFAIVNQAIGEASVRRLDTHSMACLYDTMATILTARNQYVDAVEFMKKASNLEPSDPGRRLSLAADLLQAGQAGAAKLVLKDLDAVMPLSQLPQPLRKQAEDLQVETQRASLKT